MTSILILIATLVIDVITDLKQWGRINHIRGALLRIPGIAVTVWLNPVNAAMVPLYWPIFDITLALCKGLPWFYIGTTSWLDRLQRRYRWLVWVKWGLVPISITTYILIK